MKSGKAFAEQGLQIAAGVPLECGERADYASFRIGLFGLDKLGDPARTILASGIGDGADPRAESPAEA